MIKVIEARNVNHALRAGLQYLREHGVDEDSRNGPVLVARGPVITEYAAPCERVLFHYARDANPFFHFVEALWMLAGRNDVAGLTPYVKRMAEYSDDGTTFNGAYGYRWRKLFGMDQLLTLIELLTRDPNTRRAVLQMWDCNSDLGRNSRDICCNTHAYFDLRGGALNMTVCNRSNDAYWGAHGANAVHFSVLQEFIAAALDARVGVYRQMSNNYHIYTKIVDPRVPGKGMILRDEIDDRYATDQVRPYPLVMSDRGTEYWLRAADRMLQGATMTGIPYFDDVAWPLLVAHEHYRSKRFSRAIDAAQQIAASDWRAACTEWLYRREGART